MNSKADIKSLGEDDLSAFCAEKGYPMFRVKQLREWLFEKGATSFEEMTNLPKSIRTELSENFEIDTPKIVDRQVSIDGTRKYLFEFDDGTTVESVGIPSRDLSRLTVCFSTQAGCAMGCIFCATGLNGFTRNLTTSEMYEQVRLVGDDFSMRVSNAVAMGQGEPFNNYDAVIATARLMNAKDALGIGARHITVSTCGIISGIERFSHEPEQFTLAISLHSAIQETRDRIMPGMKKTLLSSLKSTIKDYGEISGRRPTLEYALIDGVNDDTDHMEALVAFCHGMLCHVNLIPLNPVQDGDRFQNTLKPSRHLQEFESSLKKRGIEVSIRDSRGSDIDGACGQLRQKHLNRDDVTERPSNSQ